MATIMCQGCGTIIQLGEWYEDVESKKISELQSTITSQAEDIKVRDGMLSQMASETGNKIMEQADLIRRLKEDGERLHSFIVFLDKHGHIIGNSLSSWGLIDKLHADFMSKLEKRER